MSCGVGHICGLDLVLLWLWYRQAAAAPIGPVAWELPYAAGVALKGKKQTNNAPPHPKQCEAFYFFSNLEVNHIH